MRLALRFCATSARQLLGALALAGLVLPAAVAEAALRVAVISDLNGAYGSTAYEAGVARAVSRLVELRPDLVISTGDMVAGQRLHPPLEREHLQAMWMALHRHVSDPIHAAGIPMAVTPGNHDASQYPRFQLERDIYREQWLRRPHGLQFVDKANYPFNYAFSIGDVLFISIDATRVGALDEAQRTWVDELLKARGAGFRHRVAFSHLPIYPMARGRETEVTADHALERILQGHAVELYLSGHHHAFYPGFHDGIRHIGQACLGAGPRRLIGGSQVSARAITWLEFDDSGIEVSALTGPALEDSLDVSTLPPAISSPYGTLVRDDLRPRQVYE